MNHSFTVHNFKCTLMCKADSGPGIHTDLSETGTASYFMYIHVVDLDLCIIVITGEFGIVYRAHLVKNSLQSVITLPVAVKMMKGIAIICHSGFLGIVIITVVSY